MINEKLADQCIDLLNEALRLDQEALSVLFSFRPKCNSDLASHPTIQCDPDSVSVLGLLNGLCGVFAEGRRKGWGPITAVIENPSDPKIIRFERTDP